MNANAATSRAKMDFFMQIPPSLYPQVRRRLASLVCLGRAGGRVAGGVEDSEHPHGRVADVLERVLAKRREVDARAGPDRRRLAPEVQEALPFEDVDHLVVDVAVHAGATGRDDADELGDVEAADVLVDEVAKLAVRAGRQRRPVTPTHGPPAWGRLVLLRRGHRHDDEVLRPRRLDLVFLAGCDVGAGVGLELVRLAVDVERALAGDDEQDLLPIAEPPRP